MVKVGKAVGLGVLVGGSGVFVGMAACVSATIVQAAATAVFWTSAGLAVGVACGPHAVRSIVSARRIGIVRFSIFFLHFALCCLFARDLHSVSIESDRDLAILS
jgi:hypothetical protein